MFTTEFWCFDVRGLVGVAEGAEDRKDAACACVVLMSSDQR